MPSMLYIHVPFCRAKCAYCDFYSGPLKGFDADAYASALLRELSARRSEVSSRPFSSVYIGGGTPGTMPAHLLQPLIVEAADGAEVTVEVNPEDVSPQMADEWLAAGANRVSMGVQSLIDSELTAVGRRHSAATAINAFKILRAAGFSNISLDLIFGLPEQSVDSWRKSLEGVLDLSPEHLSAYLLTLEPGTLLHTRMLRGKFREADENQVVEMYDILCSQTKLAGFEHYEISNFGRPDFHSRHNSGYWASTPYLGLGSGAHSFDGNLRRFNPANYAEYMCRPENFWQIDVESDIDRHNDLMMTSLRTARGLDPAILTSQELRLAQKLLKPTPEGRLRIAEADWLRADMIMVELLRTEE